jgi:hypothetical protein
MHRSCDLLIPIIEDGIRVLIYAGVQDLMCNFIGNEVSLAPGPLRTNTIEDPPC